MRTVAFACLALSLSLSLAACADPDGDGIGERVYTPDVETLVLEAHGGAFTVEPERDVACNVWTYGAIVARFTVMTADHRLAWSYCAVDRTGSTPTYKPSAGARALTAAEWTALQPKLDALVIVAGGFCGADAERTAVIVSTGSETREYGSGFYGCEHDGRALVSADAIYAAMSALQALAR
jgi:hypothetical protein